MNVEIRTQFLFWEYLFRVFGIGSLQCDTEGVGKIPVYAADAAILKLLCTGIRYVSP
jgi:hypothetical protein